MATRPDEMPDPNEDEPGGSPVKLPGSDAPDDPEEPIEDPDYDQPDQSPDAY